MNLKHSNSQFVHSTVVITVTDTDYCGPVLGFKCIVAIQTIFRVMDSWSQPQPGQSCLIICMQTLLCDVLISLPGGIAIRCVCWFVCLSVHNICGTEYLENGRILRLGCNGPPVGNGIWRTEWLRAA